MSFTGNVEKQRKLQRNIHQKINVFTSTFLSVILQDAQTFSVLSKESSQERKITQNLKHILFFENTKQQTETEPLYPSEH